MTNLVPTETSITTQDNSKKQLSLDKEKSNKEIEAAMIIAKNFPRNVNTCLDNIVAAASRRRMAEMALYSYPRGGQQIVGPSIRLAEVLAQNFGNVSFGIKEIETKGNKTLMEVYCIDRQNNVDKHITFEVEHKISTRRGDKYLTDPREIYEHVHNFASRRLRNCILAIIPSYVVEEAVEAVNNALKKPDETFSKDKIIKMINAYKKINITQNQIEDYIGCIADDIDQEKLNKLRQVFFSINEGGFPANKFFKEKDNLADSIKNS